MFKVDRRVCRIGIGHGRTFEKYDSETDFQTNFQTSSMKLLLL